MVFVAVWLCIGGGMVTLLLAAIGNRNKGVCSNYVISMDAAAVFMQKADVEKLLSGLTGGRITNREVADFNLYELEQQLEENSWISDAELWFDNKDVLHVRVAEKKPVARIFTTDGTSYYIDRASRKIPLSANNSAKVPVFTGYPANKEGSKKDSLLLARVTETATLIYDNPFWMAQVAQIDITDNGSMEMIPLVGTHTVRLGNDGDIAQKFHRLFLFYKQVLSKKGFGSYQVIDVQYKGQVVASKGEAKNRVDASQYRKHIQKLINESNDEIVPIPGKYDLQADSVTAVTPELDEMEKMKKPVQTVTNKATNPNPTKSFSEKQESSNVKKKVKQEEKKTNREKENKQVPKAVMPKKAEPVTEENGGYD
jgi:cell division protein FtsQ